MITPLDIQNQEFTRGVRGYKPEEVDTFLDLITTDMERLIEENNNLKEQVKALSAELERYRSTEGMVLDTLEAAKALMGDISASAEKRAEILLKNAELDADRITREAREYAERLHKENENLRNRFNAFRTKYKALLESELERFDTLSKELFDDKGMEDLKSILESKTENLSYERKDDGEKEGVDFTDKTIFNFRAGSEK
ncbi:MAG: DivIVA domain-containing protein [Bacillota bacterium]|jgi:cell division initiation protein|nr:DivIVA domain-containing protein [Bacillota bacterium]NLM07887.1 DivIVA domain-containing protein [Clostridiales Family XIII bacterium]